MGIRNRRARAHSKTHIVGFTAVGVLGFLAMLAIALTVSLGALIESWLQDLPDYTSADAYLVAEPSEVYDAQGNTIATFYLENRQSVTQDHVSDYVLKGTVDVEDERFYQHNGIDPAGIVRAVFSQLAGRSEGASTITQQLVRNTVLSDEQFDKTLKRKVREAYIAVEMEKMYSKDQILMMYLNTIYYGHGAYGIQAASKTYFDKNASDLTLAEAATLIGLPNSPSYYDPTVNPGACLQRRNKVLDNMLRLGHISQEDHDAAQAQPIELNLGDTNLDQEGTYPYWTNYVKGVLEGDFSTDTIVQSGLKIYTTIDPTYQEAAQAAVEKFLSNSGNDELEQALVAIDPSTGYIKAMVGGRDYYGSSSTAQVNAATAERQTGSSFKVFTLATALQAGMNPNIVINCNSPITIGGTRFQNYGNDQYGYLSLTDATAISSNTGYLQVAEAIGIDNVVSMAKKMGVTGNLDPYLSTVLGSMSTSPLDMAASYATFASGGLKRDAVAITKIEDRNGNVVYEHQDNPQQALDAGVAKAATEALETVISGSKGTAKTMRNTLKIDQPIAGKTGTTEYLDNLWFCGYTPQVSIAVWTGYKEGSKAVRINSGSGHPYNTSCLTAAYFLNSVLDGVERADWPMADATDPSYKQNSTWDFSNTSKGYNNGTASTTSAATSDSEGNGSTNNATTGNTVTNSNSAEDAGAGGTTGGAASTPSGGGTGGGTTGGSGGGNGGGSSGGTGGGNSGGTSGGGSSGGTGGGNSGGTSGGGSSGGTGGGNEGSGGTTTPQPTPTPSQ